MTIALKFYDLIGDDDEQNEAILDQARNECVHCDTMVMSDVTYTVYAFRDGSIFRFGDNG